MAVREFRKVEFIDREKEIEYLKRRFSKEPAEILWLYGPKSTGKTTLMEYVIENELFENFLLFKSLKYNVKYINLRGSLIGTYKNFIEKFIKREDKKLFNKISGGLKLKYFEIEADIYEKLQSKEYDAFDTMVESFKRSGKQNILIIDEIQTLQDIYYNGEKELLIEFLNFCVRLTKELHLAHVVILSSNTIFIDRIYNDAKLKVTSEFKKIDHLNKETIFEYLEYKEIKEKELIWEYLGGCIPLISRMLNEIDSEEMIKEYLKNRAELAKNEIIDLADRNFNDEKYKIFEEIISNILKQNSFIVPKKTKKEVYEVIDFMAEKEILFYDPLIRKVTGNNRLYEKAFELLIGESYDS